MDGPRAEEAALAAFALGCMPVDEPELFARRAGRRVHLRSAALAMRRDPRVPLDELSLTDEERRFLAIGRFSPAQFEIAAALFRERSAAGDE